MSLCRCYVKPLLLMMLLLSGVSLKAAPVFAHSEEAAVCTRTYEPVTVDAELTDWVRRIDPSNWGALLKVKQGKVAQWMFKTPANYINKLTSKVEAGEVTDNKDFNMVFYVMWDEENLYFAAEVVDNEIVSQHEGGDIWQDDCIELWFDGRYDAITTTMFQDDEYQIGISPRSKDRPNTLKWCWRNPNTKVVYENMKVASRLTEKGYVVEASIPFASLKGVVPEACKVIGFNVSVVDKDNDQRWSHVTWSGYLHSNPTQTGKLYFVDAPIEVNISDLKKLQRQ